MSPPAIHGRYMPTTRGMSHKIKGSNFQNASMKTRTIPRTHPANAESATKRPWSGVAREKQPSFPAAHIPYKMARAARGAAAITEANGPKQIAYTAMLDQGQVGFPIASR